ncbi:MAG: hypothetical protein Q8941_07690 [Bacteroidota bacterium]|nr:hypothetical protein [Bacteroidota bacterium]
MKHLIIFSLKKSVKSLSRIVHSGDRDLEEQLKTSPGTSKRKAS